MKAHKNLKIMIRIDLNNYMNFIRKSKIDKKN